MSITNASVIVTGLLGIVWINWFFFIAGKKQDAGKSGAEVRIKVLGRYDPATTRVADGKPVRRVLDAEA